MAGQPRVARVGQLLVDDGFVVRQAGRQRPVGVRLLLQVLGLLLADGYGIGTGDEAARRLLLDPCIGARNGFRCCGSTIGPPKTSRAATERW